MQDLLTLPKSDLEDIFTQTAIRKGIGDPMIIEKDFWVVRLLDFLFSDSEFFPHHVFKGGTSLSKCFGLIKRFSEDCDITVSKASLGFDEPIEEIEALGSKKRKRYFDALTSAANEHVLKITQFLSDKIGSVLGDDSWHMHIDPHDTQKIIFEYPRVLTSSLYPEDSYIKPKILLEFGARGEVHPSIKTKITTYVENEYSDIFSKNEIVVHALSPVRTFWEKITLLHMLSNQSDEKPLQTQMALHYYDVYQLTKSDVLQQAVDDIALLKSVALHKSVYFKSKQAAYETAVPGSLRLIPNDDRLKQVANGAIIFAQTMPVVPCTLFYFSNHTNTQNFPDTFQ